MMIEKECFKCGSEFSIEEEAMHFGITEVDGEEVWVCPDCRDDQVSEEVDP